MNLIEKLAVAQSKIKSPKERHNDFGKYSYRSCEDIMRAIKPHLDGLIVHVTDEIQMVDTRIYVKATATVTDGNHSISVSAFAREPAMKKGMDDSQITGTASSYARKFALCGLFLIDDSEDADSMEVEQEERAKEAISDERFQKAMAQIKAGKYTKEKMLANFELTKKQSEELDEIPN